MIVKFKKMIIPILILCISFLIIKYLIPDYHPFGGINITMDRNSVIKKSEELLTAANITYDKNKLNSEFINNKQFTKWINSTNPLNKANGILKNSDFGFYWEISQRISDDSSNKITISSDADLLKRNQIFVLQISGKGNIIGFARKLSDDSIKVSLSDSVALLKAIRFIHVFRSDVIFTNDTSSTKIVNNFTYSLKDIETIQKQNRVDFKITWANKDSSKIRSLITARVVGDEVESFSVQPVIPEEYNSKSLDIFEVAKEIGYLLIIIISVVVIGFKRFRAIEIGFKHAIIFGIVILLSFFVSQLIDNIATIELNLLIGLLVGGIFIAGSAVLLWAVSETVFREIWNTKYLSIDLILNGKLSHSIVGKALLNGISFGFGLTALFFIFLRLLSIQTHIYFNGDYFTSQSYLTAFAPPLNLLFGVINSYGMLAVSFFMFLTAAIKRFINTDSVFILVSGLFWALLIQTNINPLPVSISVNIIFGLILSLILVRFDLLTTLSSYLILQYLIKATEFAFIPVPALNIYWYVIIIAFAAIIIIAVIFILTKDKFVDYDSIIPKFVENVTERERLRKELDVARHVQMSFLPKENPRLSGLDIASICIPALEVGGDYYDFIKINDDKFGIIIGDVSGKGTQAAFYMTLTKGFLKALAKQNESPSEVLAKMNELFYENVERGRFISMIYAIVDLSSRKIKIARAGHNPVILHEAIGSKISLLSPKGLAIGLENGEIFRKVIDEYEEDLETGKTFIFYTDGFTEASNSKDEEYGMERLSNVTSININKNAEEILNSVVDDIKKFIGKTKQHDDMTMVIIKVL